MNRIILVLIAFSCFACKETNPFKLGESVILKLDQEADCADCKDLKIKLLEIKDNRCPKNVNCIQAGQADARFLISGKTNEEITLTVGAGKKANQAKIGGYMLTLKEVNPYPEDGVKVNKENREVVFVLEGA